MRLFVAVDIPEAIRDKLRALIEDLRAGARGPRWVRPEGIHLTLRFLGEVAPADIGRLSAQLRRAVPGATSPFDVEVGALGTFPQRGRPRVIWVGLTDPAGGLGILQQRVEQAVASAAIALAKPETRPFTPHLTLARLGDGPPPHGLAEVIDRHRGVALGSFAVGSVCLFESVLRPQGAEYRKVEEYRL